ncbi:hypothetical protein FRC01_007065 [Tulasnella sp. 417]|nr:hypothetical protein FRC01_007065 [Tulasnella sp. 417]
MQDVYSSSGDDGLATLSTLFPNSIHLGQIADFWKRYDTLADSHDRKMSKHLNDNLDVLLIFAGLFSAINTAFISFTMPALSSDTATETNTLLRLLILGADNKTLALSELSQPFTPEPVSVTINSLLYASLCCSLLAAIGVMMCKEWLHSFDRSGQTGSIEDHGRLRQRKFDEAQRWHLATIIDFLPNIVLLSVGLFFLGIVVWLFTVNKTVAAVVGTFAVGGTVIGWVSILASTVFPLCPYETATARVLRRVARVPAACWTRMRDVDPATEATEMFKGASAFLSSTYSRSKEAFMRSLPFRERGSTSLFRRRPNRQQTFDSTYPENDAKEAKRQHERQVTNSHAALWLLEIAPRREDQLMAVQFLTTASKEACAAAIQYSGQRHLIISLTLEAFDIWRSQPNETTQETAEHFGRALGHVLPQARGSTEHWRELATFTQGPRLNFGKRFLRELESFDPDLNFNLFDTIGEEYILQFALLRTLVHTRDIPIETYTWTKLRFLIRNKDENYRLLGLWAMLMHKGFGDVINDDFALAVACGVQALKAVERQAAPGNMTLMLLDGVEIYSACIQRTREIADENGLRPGLREVVGEAITDMIAYFNQSSFLDPTDRRIIDFLISALQLLQSVHVPGHKPAQNDAAFEGIWYALDSVVLAINSSAEITRGYVEELVLKTLESISEWLPAKFGAYSPMVGLENHIHVIEYITLRVVDELRRSEGRFVNLMYKNRFRWFTQGSGALRTAWMDAGLSYHLIDALRRPDAWKGTAILVRILEDVTEMSMEWCRRLVADGFLTSVADVILHFGQTGDGNALGWRYIQCRLTRALLAVWHHCSAIPDIKWPMEKMVMVIGQASSATELLLRHDATKTGGETQASSNMVLNKEVVADIRERLILFLDWMKERRPELELVISRDLYRANTASHLRPTDGESSLSPSCFAVSTHVCSRDSYVENGLL